MQEIPTEQLETLKMKARGIMDLKNIFDLIKSAWFVFALAGFLVYWGADRVFATDAELKEAQDGLSKQIIATENRIKCDGLERRILDLKIERRVLLQQGLVIPPVDQEKFSEYSLEHVNECTPTR